MKATGRRRARRAAAALALAATAVAQRSIVGTNGDDASPAPQTRTRSGRCAGNDHVCGRAGDDVIGAGPGQRRDRRRGRATTRCSAAAATTAVSGGPGNDRLEGGSGDDRVSGGDGNDRLAGGPGNDAVARRRGQRLAVRRLGRGPVVRRRGQRPAARAGAGRPGRPARLRSRRRHGGRAALGAGRDEARSAASTWSSSSRQRRPTKRPRTPTPTLTPSDCLGAFSATRRRRVHHSVTRR